MSATPVCDLLFLCTWFLWLRAMLLICLVKLPRPPQILILFKPTPDPTRSSHLQTRDLIHVDLPVKMCLVANPSHHIYRLLDAPRVSQS